MIQRSFATFAPHSATPHCAEQECSLTSEMAGDEASSTTAPRSLTTPAAVAYRVGSARAPPRGGGLPLCWLALAAAAALLAALPALFSVRYRTYAVTTGSGAIVVTGASSGIGAHAAEALARKGWIVFASVRSEAGAAAVRALGVPTLLPLLLDVTQAASRAAALAAVEAELAARGGMALVALVNNAGISRSGLPLEVEPEALTREVFETNVFGALATTQTFLPLLRAAQGRIVMVSSVAGVLGGVPTMGAYAASKAALDMLVGVYAAEIAHTQMRVNLYNPGPMPTGLRSQAFPGEDQATLPPLEAHAEGLIRLALPSCTMNGEWVAGDEALGVERTISGHA